MSSLLCLCSTEESTGDSAQRNATDAIKIQASLPEGGISFMAGKPYIVKEGGTALLDLGVSGWDSVPNSDGLHDVTQYGAGGGDAAKDSDAFRRAYEAHSKVIFPAGDYEWQPVATVSPSGYVKTVHYLAEAKSDSVIHVACGATVKLADSISSQSSPKEIAFLYSVDELENVLLCGEGCFDFNKANNALSSDYLNADYRPLRHSVLWTFRTGATNLKVKDLTVKNANGLNLFVLGQPLDAHDSPLGEEVRFLGLTFENCGYNINDHTTINSYVDDTRIESCNFYNESITYAATCAFELHGSYSEASQLTVDGYHRGFFVGSRLFSEVKNQSVKDCTFNVRTQGGIIWLGENQLRTEDVSIEDNTFDIDCIKYISGGDITNYSGVTVWSKSNNPLDNIERVVIKNNTIKFPLKADEVCYGAHINATEQTGAIGSIVFEQNTVINPTKGFNLNTKVSKGSYKKFKARCNVIEGLTTSSHGSGRETGVGFNVNPSTAIPPTLVQISNNEINGLAGESSLYGSQIGSAIQQWRMDENIYSGLTKEIHKLSNDQVRILGEELRRGWIIRPTYGYWLQGERVSRSNVSAGGYAEFVCVTEGLASTFNNFKQCNHIET